MSKLDGFKKGDRFTMTVSGKVVRAKDADGDILVKYDGTDMSEYVWSTTAAHPTFHIERIARPFAVGDRVKWKANDVDAGKVVAILDDGRVVVEVDKQDRQVYSDIYPTNPFDLTHA